MTNKSTSTKISLFVAFVLVSAIFTVNGNVYAQQNVTLSEALNVTDAAEQNFTNETDSVPVEAELLPTTTDGLVTSDGLITDNATSATPRDEVAEQTDEHANETSHANTVTRDSQTILLEGESLPEGSFIHLYDSTPYQIMNGHIATKLPCNELNDTSVNVLIGQAPALNVAEFEFIPELSESGELCLYHVDVASDETTPITDIAIQNNSTEDIDFPATSTVVIGVNEIAPLAGDHHE
ncbi:hypothetical protein [Candidatus Nitrosocosmicus arcticus]|uniref:Uncharacterized protein n=1 Tax=Candidatus Nitrosocosmicus arcticus TaxID=2035267 RepID=A0A557SV24_9ARCH|nr:hypothetical protein [Candidatus Nitrosocosmicus arcticus]TVP40457.1 exported protein of unknown function [Candidatus Nitrosocosmicus arcticus]